MTKPKHDTIQPNGTCWDCGGQAIPVSNSTETQTTIGWQCGCGRFWPALGDDVIYWATSLTVRMADFARMQITNIEREIEQGRTGTISTG